VRDLVTDVRWNYEVKRRIKPFRPRAPDAGDGTWRMAQSDVDRTPPQVYEKLFGKASNRMPVMVGFNLPAFRLLDRLGLEIEWYGAKFKDDLAPYNHFRGNHPQPKPLHADTNYARDNLKWSFYGSRMLNRNVKLSFQVASDHYRPGVWVGYGDNKPASSQVLFRGPSEWYWMTKIAYFF
jgi:hypothetical protein